MNNATWPTDPGAPHMPAAADLLADKPGEQYIETCTGRALYLDNPVFDLREIAHSLAHVCRFAGHCRRFYSVAEHSVLVAKIMADLSLGDPREGLLHDGVESVLADVAAPVKVLLSDYKRLEKRLDAALREQFELPSKITDGCKTADWIALFLEARWLMPSEGIKWAYPKGVPETADEYSRRFWVAHLGDPSPAARSEFLRACSVYGLRH